MAEATQSVGGDRPDGQGGTSAAGGAWTVSVVIPCRNEAGFIERSLRSWLDNDYPPERLELLVVDGMSDDGTREAVERLGAEHASIRLLDNPQRIAACGMNIGIRAAAGDLIIVISGHAVVEPDYVSQCVRVLRENPRADRAGGVMETVNTTYVGKVIAAAMTSGVGVGGSNWRINTREGYADDAAFGAYRRDVYEKVGLYDETFVRNQDTDFISRLNEAGVRQYLCPAIRCRYYARASLWKLARQQYYNGYWLIKNLLKLRRLSPLRRIVPLAFVTGWLVLIAAGVLWRPASYALAAWAAGYLAALLVGAAGAIRRAGWAVALLTPLAFAIMHFAYGWGSLRGIWSWVIWRGRFVPRAETHGITR